MFQTHGNDYEYEINGDKFFPVVWDIRGAWMNYLQYARYYKDYEDPRAFAYADGELSGILTQAKNAGVNSVIIRESLGSDVRSGSPLYFPGRANMIRDLGLNLIPGGFGHIQNEGAFNTDMKAYLEDYLSEPVPLDYAPVVGIHGFNEPDGVYDANPADRIAIVDSLAAYHTWSNNLGLPLSSFMAMPAAYVPSLVEPHIETSSTIYQLCSYLDFPMLDWYPARTFSESCDTSIPEADIWGATDLIPTDISSNHYYAYNNRDELWSLDNDVSSGNTTFRVYEVTGEEQMGIPGFTQVFTFQPGLSWPLEVASSDYRASDVGDRAFSEHNQNAAVVMYHAGDQIEQAEVVIHNGSALTTVNPPNLNETASTMLFCVGEDNYRSSDLAANGNTGIIGSADMRILWCGDGVSRAIPERRVWILEKNSSGNGLTNTISTPLILPDQFSPTGAIWGYFWNDEFPYRQSGFILYNNIGNYVVVHTEFQDNWEVSSSVETGLFGNGINPGAVIAYRETTWPVTSYSPAKDILCALVDGGAVIHEMYMHWCSGDGETMQMSNEHEEIFLGFLNSSNFNHLSFGHCWHMNKTQFFFGGDGAVSSYYTQEFHHFPTDPTGTNGWAAETNPALYTSSWGVVNNPMRVRHTRRSWVYALMPKLVPNSNLISIRDGEMREDNNKEETSSDFASTDLYFNNLCWPGDDGLGNENGAIDLEFEWGVSQTAETNCLFANIQAFGKFPMLAASFPPSHNTGPTESDTLLYLTVAPIVHGCRGISFYALDMALQGGPASSGTSSQFFRTPNELLNWGPSRGCEENADIVSSVHDIVGMLTGKDGGPDFLNALVNHSDYDVLDVTEAVNATYFGGGYIPVPQEEYLNFIALQEDSGGEILLLVSYDGDIDGWASPLIYFPNEYACDFGDVECWGGWDPTQIVCSTEQTIPASALVDIEERAGVPRDDGGSQLSQPRLAVYLEGMPAHTVSLLRIPADSSNDSVSEVETQAELQVLRSAGRVYLQLSGEFENCDLSLFDLSGRKVEGLEISEGEGSEIQLNSSSYSAGVYFVVLSKDTDILQMEKISIF
jgi:hypothetical protein